MRVGVNPEKNKLENNFQYQHRVIIPVFIPNDTEDYYKESLEVFDTGLNSLFSTINPAITGVTIINNSSYLKVDDIIKKYNSKGLIDKYVTYNDNKGKVYAVINESRSCFEEFITIADADVLFLNGWEKKVFEIFKTIPKTGVVAPVPSPNLALYKNTTVFFDKYFKGNMRYDKIVSDKDNDLFLEGMGNSALLTRNNREFSWKQKQYFLNSTGSPVIGAGHFVATYRREVLEYNRAFPEKKFKKGYEEFYLDDPSDKLGLYRLSTSKTYAYHIGNKMDDFSKNYRFTGDDKLGKNEIASLKKIETSLIPFWVRNLVFKVLYKFLKL